MTGGHRGTPDSLAGPPAPDPDRIEQMLANPRSRVWRDEETGALLVGLNDFFVPAADAEEIPPSELATVVAAWESRGWWGILGWVIQRRYVGAAVPAPRAGLTVERLIEWADEYARTEITEPLTATLRVRHFARWLAPRLPVSPGAPAAARRAPTEAMIEAALDLRAVEARLKERQAKMQPNEHWETDDDCVVLLAHCRALRAALDRLGGLVGRTIPGEQHFIGSEGKVCDGMCPRCEAAAVLAQATDLEERRL